MNTIDIFVVEVIVPLHKTEDGLWSKTIKTDSYGIIETETITGTYQYVRKYKIGYKYIR